MDLIGKTLGQYQITEVVGSGGMATVYKAYQPGLDRFVAIKVLSGQLAADPQFRQRFDREAKEAARLSHPHILPVYDSGEDQGSVYIVTELVDGGSLRDRVTQPFGPAVAARITCDIAGALDYAHRMGLVHRDVKPGNVLITRDGRTLLADFGIAKVVAGTQYTQTGMAVGTPAYMSPEQARGDEVDGRSDLYSLGIMLYEMLVGFPPFQADTPLALLHQQITAVPPPPRTLNPSIPKRLERVVLTALAKEPGDRYATGRELATAIEEAVRLAPPEQIPGIAGAASPTVPLRKPTPRKITPRGTQAGGQPAARGSRRAGRAGWRIARFLLRFVLILALVLLVLGVVGAIGGASALGSFAQRTIPKYAGELQAFESWDQELIYTEEEMNASVGTAIAPYSMDLVQGLAFDLDAPDKALIHFVAFKRQLRLQTRLAAKDGKLQVFLERLNGVPLYLVGGIVSRGVNRGTEGLFRQAYFRLDRLEVMSNQILLQASRQPGAPSSTPTPVPTIRAVRTPTEVPMGMLKVNNLLPAALVLDVAGTKHTIEAGGTLELSLRPGTYSYSYEVLAPNFGPDSGEVALIAGVVILDINPEPTATPSLQPTKAPATKRPSAKATPVRTATPRPARCPVAGVAITSPGVGANLRGKVSVQGSASLPGFDFYKLELGAGVAPQEWVVLGALHQSPVTKGLLGEWDAGAFPAGTYVLRVAVIDNTGNFKACDVQVLIVR